jgi:hypothetical protein
MLSYAKDIKSMFRNIDVESMKPRGLDLWAYKDVQTWADDILTRLEDGSMPCDGRWQQTAIDNFRQWITDGKLP